MSKDPDPRLLTILERLLWESRTGGVTWIERNSISRYYNVFEFSAESYGTVVRTSVIDDSIELIVKNSNGDEVGRLTSVALARNSPRDNLSKVDTMLEELSQAALRTARRVDETLDQILADLDETPPF